MDENCANVLLSLVKTQSGNKILFQKSNCALAINVINLSLSKHHLKTLCKMVPSFCSFLIHFYFVLILKCNNFVFFYFQLNASTLMSFCFSVVRASKRFFFSMFEKKSFKSIFVEQLTKCKVMEYYLLNYLFEKFLVNTHRFCCCVFDKEYL